MCTCMKYDDLDLSRDCITKRIKHSKKISKKLKLVATNADKEHKLYKCDNCEQFWQGSHAWHWGNYEYLFKVPFITTEKWLEEAYVQPDRLFTFLVGIETLIDPSTFEEKNNPCRNSHCEDNAVSGSAFCLKHHIKQLQNLGQIPSVPEGKWFYPYHEDTIVPTFF